MSLFLKNSLGLRMKFALVIGVIFVVMFWLFYAYTQIILQRNFERLEKNELANQIGRLVSTVNGELDVLANDIVDWSAWDAAYDFTTRRNEQFIIENYAEGTLKGLGLDLILHSNLAGEAVYNGQINPKDSLTLPIAPQLLMTLQRRVVDPVLELQRKNLHQRIRKNHVIRIGDRLLLVATHSILHTNLNGPSVGMQLFGRFLDQSHLERIKVKTRSNVVYVGPDQIALSLSGTKLDSNGIWIDTLRSGDLKFGYVLYDLDNQPVGAYVADYPRNISQVGQTSIFNTMLGIVVMGSLLVVLVGIVTNHLFLRRVMRLRGDLRDLDQKTLVFEDKKGDELSFLQHEINRLLVRLDDQKDEILQKAAELYDAKEAAERANAAKSDFLSQVNHELRTPLAGVIGVLQVLSGRELPDARRSEVKLALSNAESLLRIVNDLLDLAKVESGKMDLDLEPFSIQDLVDEHLEVLRSYADMKGLELDLRVNPEVPSFVLGDGHRLRQVLLNILGNALKFTEFGFVRLEVRCEQIRDNLASLVFIVDDSGIGISPEAQQKLFQKFEQASSDTARKFGGTGLGLAICKDLVELMGGSIELHSTLGQGTRFDIKVQLAVVADHVIENARTNVRQSHSLRVLGVEDGSTNQWICEKKWVVWAMRLILPRMVTRPSACSIKNPMM